MDLDIFLRKQNVERYRRLIDSSVGSAERRTILNLLAEEMEALKNGDQQKALSRRISSMTRIAG